VGPLRRGLGEGARVVWGCPDADGMPPSFSGAQLVTKAIGSLSVVHYPRFALNHASRSVFSCRVSLNVRGVRASRGKADCRLAPQP
jgi:hypothetical protein